MANKNDVTAQVTVRPVTQDDYANWKVLWDGYNAFYGREGATELPDEITQLTWSRFFDGYEPVHALVAEISGQLVGLVHYLFHRNTIQLGPSCYLQDLFTASAARGQGIGRALIEAVYEAARRNGAQSVYWQTEEANATARHLYDRVSSNSGFIVYRTKL